MWRLIPLWAPSFRPHGLSMWVDFIKSALTMFRFLCLGVRPFDCEWGLFVVWVRSLFSSPASTFSPQGQRLEIESAVFLLSTMPSPSFLSILCSTRRSWHKAQSPAPWKPPLVAPSRLPEPESQQRQATDDNNQLVIILSQIR